MVYKKKMFLTTVTFGFHDKVAVEQSKKNEKDVKQNCGRRT